MHALPCLWNQLPLSLRQPYSGTSSSISDSPLFTHQFYYSDSPLWATRFFYFFPYFFVSGRCARLSWPSRQLLSWSTVSYRIVYRIVRAVVWYKKYEPHGSAYLRHNHNLPIYKQCFVVHRFPRFNDNLPVAFYPRGRKSRGGVFTGVPRLSVYPHDVSITDAARIAKLDTQN